MKKLPRAFYMCLTTFTALPCPHQTWDEAARPWMTALLPLIGLILGALHWLLALLLHTLRAPAALAAALLAAFPFLATGLMHLDGFMDTADAVLSWRPLEDRLRILKDPHAGSFSVICVCLLILFQFAAMHSAIERAFDARALICVPVLTRAAASFAVSRLRPLGHSQYAHADAAPWTVAAAFAAAGLLGAFLLAGASGLVAGMAALAGYALAARHGVRSLGGMSGDISGYALTIGELCAALALALY